MKLTEEQVGAALGSLSKDLDGADPRLYYMILVREGEVRAVPNDPDMEDVLRWRPEDGWQWIPDDGTNKPEPDFYGRLEIWWQHVKRFADGHGFVVSGGPDDAAEEALRNDVSSWAYARKICGVGEVQPSLQARQRAALASGRRHG